MPTQIFEHNIPELQSVYGKKFPSDEGKSGLTTIVEAERADFGAFHVSNLTLPGTHVMKFDWKIPGELIIHESSPSENVDINFMLKGNIRGIYKSLGDIDLSDGTCNLKYTPAQKSSHYARQQDVCMFAIALEKRYFQSLIGYDSRWAENIQRKMENEEDFFGSGEFLPMTPRMHAIIHSVRNIKPAPMTRIMTQSLVLELIGQQVEQLACLSQTKSIDAISTDDIAKLRNAKEFIERHFLEDLTLTSICREVILNEFKLKKGFRKVFNTGVIQYVRQLRMEFAQGLLRDNSLTVEEVASKLGYRYPNHFSVAYKKHFGVVPSERRKARS